MTVILHVNLTSKGKKKKSVIKSIFVFLCHLGVMRPMASTLSLLGTNTSYMP